MNLNTFFCGAPLPSLFLLAFCACVRENSATSASDIKRQTNIPAYCHFRPEAGNCEAYIPSYYFDGKKCQEFIYGGCGGNQNNFSSKEECLKACGNISEQAPMVVESLQKMFDALSSGDLSAYKWVVTPDFYLFDVGQKLSSDAFWEAVKKSLKTAKLAKWKVTKPEVHISGELAWVTYENHGVFEVNGEKKEKMWLESAVLELVPFMGRPETWRIRFLHSTEMSRFEQLK